MAELGDLVTPFARALLSVSMSATLGVAPLRLPPPPGPLPRPSTPRIPLCAGLTIVTAVSQPDGDYESIKTVQSVSDADVAIRYASEYRVGGVIQKTKVQRRVLLEDMRSATLYLRHFDQRGAVTVPGTTAIGTSGAVLHALKLAGAADLGIFDPVSASAPANPSAHPNVYDYQMVETIHRVGASVAVPMVVNDIATTLPAIEARGDYTGDRADFLFLDDETNPIALRYTIGRDQLDVVKISYRCTGDRPDARGNRLERSLLETGRADVYSIYFSFNSDEIREESDSTLREIGDVLRRHPEWRLAIAGHTDGIGDDRYNLELSRRRAAAVKTALVARFSVGTGRLVTEGYGETRPKDTNNTLEGRARNRRVELVRLP